MLAPKRIKNIQLLCWQLIQRNCESVQFCSILHLLALQTSLYIGNGNFLAYNWIVFFTGLTHIVEVLKMRHNTTNEEGKMILSWLPLTLHIFCLIRTWHWNVDIAMFTNGPSHIHFSRCCVSNYILWSFSMVYHFMHSQILVITKAVHTFITFQSVCC